MQTIVMKNIMKLDFCGFKILEWTVYMEQMTAVMLCPPQASALHVLEQSACAWVEQTLAQCQIEVQQTLPAQGDVLVIGGACPAIDGQTYQKLVELHRATGAQVTVLTGAKIGEATRFLTFGADHQVAGVSAKPTDCCAYPIAVVSAALVQNMQDFWQDLHTVLQSCCYAQTMPCGEASVVTDGMSAYHAQCEVTQAINLRHIANGVQIYAMNSTYIAPDAQIGAGTVILPNTIIRAGCVIGCNAKIGPSALLEKAHIGDGTSVNNSQVYESTIGANVTVGPFAYVRPKCVVGDHARIGDFVELKNAKIGNGTKVSHLTYIGDAVVGERVNFGCGTVVVNYDGYHKHLTEIGDDCFIGCNTNLVAPVKLGDRVFTAAATTVTREVPDGALSVSRVRQENREGWNDKRRARMEKQTKN